MGKDLSVRKEFRETLSLVIAEASLNYIRNKEAALSPKDFYYIKIMARSAGATSDMLSSQDTILYAISRSDPPPNRDAPPSIFAEGRNHT